MLISLTVGKVDAGVAVLLTEDKRLIEFPSILLPPSISSGSIVDITVARNIDSEARAQKSFLALQESIYSTYGQASPSPPVLRCRNATQTSVVLEWDPIQLATAEVRSLSLYRNGSKAGSIPRPTEITSTKISGLAVDTEYTFHLVLRTSAGQYSSEKLPVRTHKMTDLSGITVTPGVLPTPLRESLSGAVERIGGKIVDVVRIDTTHFVCIEGRGKEWERALEMNIPVVRPEWVEGCEREGRIVGVRGYYLNADPKLRQVGQGVGLQPQFSPRPDQRSRNDSQQNASAQPAVHTVSVSNANGPIARQGTFGEATNRPSLVSPPPPTPLAKDEPSQSGELPSRHTTANEPTVNESEPAAQEPNSNNENESEKENAIASPTIRASEDEPEQRSLDAGEENETPRTPGDAGSFSEVAL